MLSTVSDGTISVHCSFFQSQSGRPTAHHGAYDAGVLHGDISINNILIDLDTGEGILNDWDLAKYVSDITTGSNQLDRAVGYMQYIP